MDGGFDESVEVFVIFFVEGHLDGEDVDRQAVNLVMQTHSIFLRGDDEVVAARQGSEGLLDAGDVARGEVVVVGEREVLHFGVAAQLC